MQSELWQLMAMRVLFAVALVPWLRIVYLSGRTLERWEDHRVKVAERPHPAKPEDRDA